MTRLAAKDGPVHDVNPQEVWEAVLAQRDRAVRVAAARCASRDQVDDCVQEGLARVVEMPHLDLQRVGPMLSVVTGNLALDTHRDAVRRDRLVRTLTARHQDQEGPEEAVCDAAEGRWLAGQLDRLSPGDRAVLELRAEGRTLTEAAGELGITYRAAENAYGRARAALKAAWRTTLAVGTVLTAPRLPRGTSTGATAVAVACTVALGGPSPQPPAVTPEFHAPTPVRVVPTPGTGNAPAAIVTTAAPAPNPAPDLVAQAQSSPLPDAATATRVVVAAPAVNAGPVRRDQTTVTREHDNETLTQTVARCVDRGVVIRLDQIGCRD